MSRQSEVILAPSILAADLLRLYDEVMDAEKCGADWHHVDVMDGHFVPNLSFGLPVIRALKSVCTKPLDVHIMVDNPDDVASLYLDAGADILTFHVEAAKHPHRLAQLIRGQGRKVGVSINPGSPLELLWPLIEVVDVILIMSVNPGFGGQSFIGATLQRIETLAQRIAHESKTRQIHIEVDGGVTPVNARSIINAGATALVTGTSFYASKDRAMTAAKLKGQ